MADLFAEYQHIKAQSLDGRRVTPALHAAHASGVWLHADAGCEEA